MLTVPALGKQLYSALHSVQLYNHTVSKNEIEGDQLGEQLYSALHTVCSCTITLFQTLYKRSEKGKKGHSTAVRYTTGQSELQHFLRNTGTCSLQFDYLW